jgi:hypothetical protein
MSQQSMGFSIEKELGPSGPMGDMSSKRSVS